MPRTLTSQMISALTAPVVRTAIFAELQMSNETLYLWSGLGPMTWNGMTFQGVGTLGKVQGISEDTTVEAKGVKISLSGIPSNMIGEALNNVRLMQAVNLWLMCFDTGGALISSPVISFSGLMDKTSIDDDGSTSTITINVENVLADLNRPVARHYTQADQQLDLALTLQRLGLPANTVDTGFSHVNVIQELTVFWGQNPKSVNNQ
jgi:hypothetical protein